MYNNFVVRDHNQFLELILSQEITTLIELNTSDSPVPLFFDKDIYQGTSDHFDNGGIQLLDHIENY
jgi:hypothetical protein